MRGTIPQLSEQEPQILWREPRRSVRAVVDFRMIVADKAGLASGQVIDMTARGCGLRLTKIHNRSHRPTWFSPECLGFLFGQLEYCSSHGEFLLRSGHSIYQFRTATLMPRRSRSAGLTNSRDYEDGRSWGVGHVNRIRFSGERNDTAAKLGGAPSIDLH